jgi:hypothetical protein
MISFFTLDELSCLKGSEPLTEKIEDILVYIRKKGFSVKISPCRLNVEKNRFTSKLSISFSFQPSLSHSPLSLLQPSQQSPHKPQTFLDTFSSSISS